MSNLKRPYVEAACLVQSLCFMAGETETQRGFVTDQLPSW